MLKIVIGLLDAAMLIVGVAAVISSYVPEATLRKYRRQKIGIKQLR